MSQKAFCKPVQTSGMRSTVSTEAETQSGMMNIILVIMTEHGIYDCRRLILASKAQMKAFVSHRLSKVSDPLQLMEEEAQRPSMSHLRLSIRLAVEEGYYYFIPPVHYSVRMMDSMQLFRDMYKQNLKGKLALARGSNLSDAKFTYHLVTRLIISKASKEEKAYYQAKAEKYGGEVEIHKFITFQKVC